jgi:hypothetical protein
VTLDRLSRELLNTLLEYTAITIVSRQAAA